MHCLLSIDGDCMQAAELAFLMANMAKVQPGNVVYDPFVGTGATVCLCCISVPSGCISDHLSRLSRDEQAVSWWLPRISVQ